MSRLILGPFNRVEGDLEVHLDIEDGRVRAARVNSPLYRGFEQILRDRPALDALVIAPRICGICSVSQSVAAARALAAAGGIEMPENGRLATDLVLATENVADHLSHFILFFLPDFARPVYADRPWHAAAARRFTALKGEAGAEFIAARARFLHVMGLLAGKWPHSLALQPGGVTKAVDGSERVRLLSVIAEFRQFLERRLFGDDLERVAALDSPEALAAWAAEAAPDSGDARLFLHIAEDLGLEQLGRTGTPLMSYGSFGLIPRGLWKEGPLPLPLGAIREDVSHAWMAGGPLAPARGRTEPDADRADAYSWCKAPRLDSQPVEVGALARQTIAGQPLIRALTAAAGGGNVHNRVIARLIEAARLVLAMEDWTRALRPREPFHTAQPIPADGDGAGLVEAARGSLGHWLSIRGGKIANYQIIAPTTWNFSPRDGRNIPGPLEQALEGAPLRPGEATPIAVQHIVRSFDPCMACTVH